MAVSTWRSSVVKPLVKHPRECDVAARALQPCTHLRRHVIVRDAEPRLHSPVEAVDVIHIRSHCQGVLVVWVDVRQGSGGPVGLLLLLVACSGLAAGLQQCAEAGASLQCLCLRPGDPPVGSSRGLAGCMLVLGYLRPHGIAWQCSRGGGIAWASLSPLTVYGWVVYCLCTFLPCSLHRLPRTQPPEAAVGSALSWLTLAPFACPLLLLVALLLISPNALWDHGHKAAVGERPKAHGKAF